jgi:hypothetical protein
VADVSHQRKVLLIGWDAADWEHITPLLEESLMPTLDEFINRGVILTLRAASFGDLLLEGRIALARKFQNRRIGLTCFFDFNIPRLYEKAPPEKSTHCC